MAPEAAATNMCCVASCSSLGAASKAMSVKSLGPDTTLEAAPPTTMPLLVSGACARARHQGTSNAGHRREQSAVVSQPVGGPPRAPSPAG
jgi:hypothetical protein